MSNWCSTSYAIEGDVQEVKKLYELMKELEERKEPSVKNDFGTTWLGCLVNALGGDWNEVWCRGYWSGLEIENGVLKFITETAWSPCNATFDFVCQKFSSLRYYFQSEELGMSEYKTNDCDSKYFTDRYVVEISTPDNEYGREYFTDLTAAFKWVEEMCGQPVKSKEEVEELVEQWHIKNKQAYCRIDEFQIE